MSLALLLCNSLRRFTKIQKDTCQCVLSPSRIHSREREGLQNRCWSNKQRSKPHIWHLDLGTSSMTDLWKAEVLPFFSLHQFMVRMPTLQHQSSCFKDPLKDYTHTGFLPTDTGGLCPEGSPWSDLSYESVVEQLPVDPGKSHTMDPCATCPPSKYPQWRQWSPITVNPKQCDSRA